MQSENMKDLRHLSNSLRHALKRASFISAWMHCTLCMFGGTNKSNLRNRFSLSVKARALAELMQAHKKYNRDLDKIKPHMPSITDTLIMRFKGNYGSQYPKHSLVCIGDPGQIKIPAFKV